MSTADVTASVHINAPPGLVVNPTSLGFGNIDPGASASLGFTVQADSLRALGPMTFAVNGNPPGSVSLAFSISANPADPSQGLPAGDAMTVEVTLDADPAAAPGDYTFDISVSA